MNHMFGTKHIDGCGFCVSGVEHILPPSCRIKIFFLSSKPAYSYTVSFRSAAVVEMALSSHPNLLCYLTGIRSLSEVEVGVDV